MVCHSILLISLSAIIISLWFVIRSQLDLFIKSIEKEFNEITIHNKRMFNRIASAGALGIAESYIDGDWDCDDLFTFSVNAWKRERRLRSLLKQYWIIFLFLKIKGIVSLYGADNTVNKSKKNISFHYNDVGQDLYRKMLGKLMVYSSAYFYKPNMTLEEAQSAKMALIAKKLDLRPGMKVLEIGFGWGVMMHYLATTYDVQVIGVTLSVNQQKFAQKYYSHHNVTYRLQDYRQIEGKRRFDRIFSVGMFEHIGRNSYHEYYDKCLDLLKDDGIMLIHTIVTNRREWTNDGFINKYIFPGGQIPHASHFVGDFIDKWHLEDIHNFGISYGKTLKCWRDNIGDWKGLEKYPERFRRTWHLYLIGCAAAFQCRRSALWQLVYTKRYSNRNDDCHHIRSCNLMS